MPVQLIPGPPINKMSKEAATQALLRNPDLPKDAEIQVEAHAGQWIAAIHWSAPPFEGGGPADAAEESPAPKSEGPGDAEPSEGGGDGDGDADDKPSSDGPPSEGGDKPPHEKGAEGGDKAEHKIEQMLQALCDALGVTLPGDAGGMIPGADAGMGGPGGPPGMGGLPPGPAGPPMPPHGHGGPPPGPAGPAGPDGPNQHVIHEKAGPPPVPTFSSVPDDHPWREAVGKVQHFRVASVIGEQSLPEVEAELRTLASAGGFGIKRLRETRDEAGQRIAEAIISTPRL